MTIRVRLLAFSFGAAMSMGSISAVALTLTIEPEADTSLFEVAVAAPETANSRGVHLFAGRITTGERRRALLRFNLSAIPPASTITSAQLSLSLTRDPPGPLPAVNFSLYPLASAWGEGSSDAGDPGGNGTAATPGDPTWTQRAFPATPWSNAGGDVAMSADATTAANTLGRYQWGSTAAMVNTSQLWVDFPSTNFGWALLADESAGTLTARRFASREAVNANTRPQLLIEYTPANVGPPGQVSSIPTLSSIGNIALLLMMAWLAHRHVQRQRALPR